MNITAKWYCAAADLKCQKPRKLDVKFQSLRMVNYCCFHPRLVLTLIKLTLGKQKKNLATFQLSMATSVHRIHKKCAKPASWPKLKTQPFL